MSNELKTEYITILRGRYQKSGKKEKGLILTQLCENTGLSRKHTIRALNKKQRTKINGQRGMFDNLSQKNEFRMDKTEPASKSEKLSWEKELLGLFISSHPLDDFKGLFEKKSLLTINKIKKSKIKNIKIGGLISGIKKIITRTGKPMLFLSLEDLNDKIEVVVFPSIIQKNPLVFQENKIVFVSGHVDFRDGMPKLICEEIEEIFEA